MTYNVNYGMAGDGPTLDAIRDSGADVVFLQEINPAWEEELTRELAADYPHMVFRTQGAAGGLAVLSVHAFEEEELVDSPIGWFPAQRVIIDSPIGEVQVLQVHLKPPVSVANYLSTPKQHVQEMEAFTENLDETLPTLIVGDFNEKRKRAIKRLEKAGYVDVGPKKKKTWRWQTRLGEVRGRLDHIFMGPGLSATDADVLDVGRSDHLPVIATFEIVD